MSELNGHEEDRLAEAVSRARVEQRTAVVDIAWSRPRPLDYLDILGVQEDIRRATKGTGVWGYVAVVRNEPGDQELALLLSPRDGGP